ncbi:hypothetical protein JSMCR1_2510 [Escherichia coli]|nr:hypothetical protein JSMCR1_2510 [Escherichia coli]
MWWACCKSASINDYFYLRFSSILISKTIICYSAFHYAQLGDAANLLI